MEFNMALSRYAFLTEERLKTDMDALNAPPILADSMRYSLLSGGKRLRPALCLASCELCGGRAEDALSCAAALEMIHCYSLVHDDLPAMDNDTLRRGRPTNHVVFGEANAILAGDGLLSLAFRLLAADARPEAALEIAAGAFDMVSGQSMDINAAGEAAQLPLIHKKKTGALFLAAVRAGARCAGADGGQLGALSEFAEAFGLLFQITDDILDACGSAAALGKSVGKDAAADKLTFVTLLGVEGARAAAAEAAERALTSLLSFGADAAFFQSLIQTTLWREK